MSAEQLFFNVEQKTDKQHILDNPDTYIGSVESIDTGLWVVNETGDKIIEKNINYIPGLFKLFDEGIVNCRDHVVRMKTKVDANVENALSVTNIEVTIEDDGTITMLNDGNGIDVAQKDGIWIPELVFGHLRTSTNYDKTEKKIVGGKNGFGFKLVLIWSSYGRIETVDHIRGLKYIQEYKNNLDDICKPSISKCKTKPYTKITFKPDYARLGINGLTNDIKSLFQKRVYDIGALTDKTVKVKYNNAVIPVKNFEQYINMYIGDKSTNPRVYEENGERWEYAVALSPTNEFVQVSFVNGIHTSKGGKHVEYILNQITKKTAEAIGKKKKVTIPTNVIKEQLIIFLRCDIENPSFDSQTKDYMNTPYSKFGSKCEVGDKFIEKIMKMGGLMDVAVELTEIKTNKEVAKKTDGTKSKKIRGIPKLTDANWAGTEKSRECILILGEGDSAKTGILSGLDMDSRDRIGVYPLKGKLMNVRGATTSKISENKEITELKKIIGLVNSKKYKTMEDIYNNLRYAKILIMTDQDLDGTHIKALIANLFSSEWPELLELPFIGFMNTPILKATKNENNVLDFYNEQEFQSWKELNSLSGWKIKYYKGLGTSTGKEFKQYFKNRKTVDFEFTGDECADAIDKVFNKNRADDRKEWLRKDYNRNLYVDTNQTTITYKDFINKELIHFSKYDCDRNIPNLMDGLKISQRKVVYAAIKRKLTSEFKVAQFAGYVSEHSGYHHGEDSLNGTIVGMAQNFVGSNNINLFMPNGQFGTRTLGGKDSASPRYIYTLLNNLTTKIFHEDDFNILEYLQDDGMQIEPTHYAPIIPMILVNGANGIGTGFSCNVLCYDPLQIMERIENKLLNIDDDIDFIPYYEGFKGDVIKQSDNKFMFKGKYHKTGTDQIRVTELPVGYWTESFKEKLELLCADSSIKDYVELWTDSEIVCDIIFPKGQLDKLESEIDNNGCNGVEKLLKLYSTDTTTNMYLFDENDILQKYESVSDIIDAYYDVRLQLYQKRKDYLIEKITKELSVLTNKTNYIKENLEGTIDLRGKKTSVIVDMLREKGYDDNNDDNYRYLIKMPMDSVTEENIQRLTKERDNKLDELNYARETTINKMWLNDLDKLKDEYIKYKADRSSDIDVVVKDKKTTSAKEKKTTTTKEKKTTTTKEKKSNPKIGKKFVIEE